MDSFSNLEELLTASPSAVDQLSSAPKATPNSADCSETTFAPQSASPFDIPADYERDESAVVIGGQCIIA
ncbi:hypothetical protein PM082_021303 [Marasmius tenuissimus]|nr:hypothetical protein PM082_021303 [Marasmius tenuissimus]